jgi:hypothetical protein
MEGGGMAVGRRSRNQVGVWSRRERERERGVFFTIKKGLKVGKHNALPGNTASGRTGSSI